MQAEPVLQTLFAALAIAMAGAITFIMPAGFAALVAQTFAIGTLFAFFAIAAAGTVTHTFFAGFAAFTAQMVAIAGAGLLDQAAGSRRATAKRSGLRNRQASQNKAGSNQNSLNNFTHLVS
jgi:membrane protein implicated in regulation of membrane protease activity